MQKVVNSKQIKFQFWVNYPFKRTVKQQAAICAIFHKNYKLSADMLFASPLCKHASMYGDMV